MRFILFLLTVVLLPVVSLAKFVAVLETLADPAAKDVVTLSDRTYLTDVLRSEAVKVLPAEQNFTIMTRENINAMLPPGKSIEECEGSCLAETGRNIAADYVAQARVGMFGGSLTLSVEIYETAGNKLVAGFNGDGETVKDLLNIIKQESPEFFKKVKGSSSSWGGVTGFSDISGGGDFSIKGKKSFIIEVVTNPAGAALSIDGRPVPKCMQTPCRVHVEEGEHLFVAVIDRYDDGEVRTMISATNKTVNMELAPNFGTLLLDPQLAGVGRLGDISIWVDGAPVKHRKLELDPGIHEVRLSHPCYDPMGFKVGIEKMGTARFEEPMKRGIGGLKLDAEWNGEPQALPVYVDGEEVGSTPFLGEVPLCAKVTVGEAGLVENVDVKLRWHETVEYTHNLRNKPATVAMSEDAERKAREKKAAEEARRRADAAYTELDGNEPQIGESIPTGVESEPAENHGIHWVPVGISAAVAVTGTVLAVVGNSNAKTASEREIASEQDYKKNKDDAHSGQTLRTVGIVTAIVGAIGLGLSFAF